MIQSSTSNGCCHLRIILGCNCDFFYLNIKSLILFLRCYLGPGILEERMAATRRIIYFGLVVPRIISFMGANYHSLRGLGIVELFNFYFF